MSKKPEMGGRWSIRGQTGKKPSWSHAAYWLGEDEEEETFWQQHSLSSVGKSDVTALSKLASTKRAIANFVWILTHKDIPVEFSSGDQSYTDYQKIVISANTQGKKFDSVVGLAMHEASHNLLTNVAFTQSRPFYSFWASKKVAKLAEALKMDRNVLAEFLNLFRNVLEDRRIDAWQYREAPGYQPYYEALYDQEFFDPAITMAIKTGQWATPTLTNYYNQFLNIIHPEFDPTQLPGLKQMAKLADLVHIDRLDDDNFTFANQFKAALESNFGTDWVRIQTTRQDDVARYVTNYRSDWYEAMPKIWHLVNDIAAIAMTQVLKAQQEQKAQQQQQQQSQQQESGQGGQGQKQDKQEESEDQEPNLDAPMPNLEQNDQQEKDDEQSEGDGEGEGSGGEGDDEDDSDKDSDSEGDEESDKEGDQQDKGKKDDKGKDKDADDADDTDDDDAEGDDKESDKEGKEKEGKDGKPTKPKALTPKQRKELAAALEKQKNFMEGKVEKEAITQDAKEGLTTFEAAGTGMQQVGWGSGFKCNVLTIKNVTMEVARSSVFPWAQAGLEDGTVWPHYQSSVDKGWQMGLALANRLAIRNREIETRFNRQAHGRMDKRLVNALGFDAENVFYQSHLATYKPVHVHLTLDASSSMAGPKWEKALTVATALAVAADKLKNIDVVISMRAGPGGNVPVLAIVYDSRKDKISKVRRLFPGLFTKGGTPEALTFDAIREELTDTAKGQTKYFINISDGQPGDAVNDLSGSTRSYGGEPAFAHTRAVMNDIRASGIHILSYLVGSAGDEPAFRAMYGRDAAIINVEELGQLVQTLNKLFSVRSDA